MKMKIWNKCGFCESNLYPIFDGNIIYQVCEKCNTFHYVGRIPLTKAKE